MITRIINTVSQYGFAIILLTMAYFNSDFRGIGIFFGCFMLLIAVSYTFSARVRDFIDRFTIHYKPDEDRDDNPG